MGEGIFQQEEAWMTIGQEDALFFDDRGFTVPCIK